MACYSTRNPHVPPVLSICYAGNAWYETQRKKGKKKDKQKRLERKYHRDKNIIVVDLQMFREGLSMKVSSYSYRRKKMTRAVDFQICDRRLEIQEVRHLENERWFR